MSMVSSDRITWVPVVAGVVPDIRWDDARATVSMLQRQRLLGLVSSWLSEGVLTAPGIHRNMIDRAADAERTRGVMIALEARRLQQLMTGRLHPPVVLKGPSVASQYVDPQHRMYCDLDLMVRRDEVADWEALLQSRGFQRIISGSAVQDLAWAHATTYRRRVGKQLLEIDVHTSMWIERRARRFGYDQLVSFTHVGEWGWLVPDRASLLVLLALHLYRSAEPRALIWYRDFIELGDPDSVLRARLLAKRYDVDWALEAALHDVEEMIRQPRWGAFPEAHQMFGLARVMRHRPSAFLCHAAGLREVGLRRAPGYVLGVTRSTRSAAAASGESLPQWLRRHAGEMRHVPWSLFLRDAPNRSSISSIKKPPPDRTDPHEGREG